MLEETDSTARASNGMRTSDLLGIKIKFFSREGKFSMATRSFQIR